MKMIIQNIEDKLMRDVPALKYVDQDWGQMDYYQNPPVNFPCALIDIQAIDYSDVGEFVQQGNMRVIIRVFDLRLSNSSGRAPIGQKEKVREIWNLLEAINKSLHAQNFLQPGYGLPMRKGMRRTKREDGCFQTELYYQVQLTDDSCKPVIEITEAKPIVTVSLLKEV